MTSTRRTLDVSMLPSFAFGHRALVAWGTLGFMVIEGTMFVVALIAYCYLRMKVSAWPPGLPDPALTPGTINLVVALVAIVPAALAKRAAEQFDLKKVRLWLSLLTVLNFLSMGIRVFEYPALNCRWDDNAYASMVWLLLSLHTIHLATDAVESAVLSVLMFTGPVTKRRLVDVAENSFYWYFIAAWWIPIYLAVYFAPRWL